MGRGWNPENLLLGAGEGIALSRFSWRPRRLIEFVRHLLAVIGYRAETTQYSRDKGVDVMGSLNAEGLAEIRLQIQVKRYEKGSIGARIVRELKGSLSIEEHGCIITTSTFSNEAYEEAEKPGHKAIKLIDRDDLAGLILKHFDDIDDDYKKRLGIRRKKDFNIRAWPLVHAPSRALISAGLGEGGTK